MLYRYIYILFYILLCILLVYIFIFHPCFLYYFFLLLFFFFSCVFSLLVLLLLRQISPWGLIKYISIYLSIFAFSTSNGGWSQSIWTQIFNIFTQKDVSRESVSYPGHRGRSCKWWSRICSPRSRCSFLCLKARRSPSPGSSAGVSASERNTRTQKKNSISTDRPSPSFAGSSETSRHSSLFCLREAEPTLTLMPPMRCSPLNSRPFFSQRMLGMGLAIAGQRNFTVLPAGTAYSFFSIRWVWVQ